MFNSRVQAQLNILRVYLFKQLQLFYLRSRGRIFFIFNESWDLLMGVLWGIAYSCIGHQGCESVNGDTENKHVLLLSVHFNLDIPDWSSNLVEEGILYENTAAMAPSLTQWSLLLCLRVFQNKPMVDVKLRRQLLKLSSNIPHAVTAVSL